MPSGPAQCSTPCPQVADRIGIAILSMAAVLGPVALGGTWTWARLGLETTMAAAAVLWACSGPRPRRLVLLPLAMAGLLSLQILPLPAGLLRWIAPLSAEAWQATPRAAATGWGTISVDPGSTAAGIRRLLLGLATIAVVADLGRQDWARRWLTAALACSAVVVWGLGLAFRVDSSERVLLGFIDLKGPLVSMQTTIEEPLQTGGGRRAAWVEVAGRRYLEDWGPVGDGFGSYICSNHFAGALELTLPVALALWLWLSRGRLPDVLRHAAALAAVAAATWTAGRLADSRAGAAAMLLAGLSLVALAMERPWPRRIATAVTLSYAAALFVFLVAFFGPWTGLEQLLPTGLQAPLRALRSDGRVVASRVAGSMVAGSPFLGTGIGTFGEVQPTFIGTSFYLAYAHNDYLQLVAETGLLGAAFAVCLAGILLAHGWRFVRASPAPERILAAGPWAALAGLTLHSFFDWNVHVPANALLASLVSGLCLASGGVPAARRECARAPRIAAMALVAACLVSLVVLGRDALATVRRRDLAMAIAMARGPDPQTAGSAAQERLAAAVAACTRADAWNPADARIALLMGRAYLELAAAAHDTTTSAAAGAAADGWFDTARSRSAVSLAGVTQPPR